MIIHETINGDTSDWYHVLTFSFEPITFCYDNETNFEWYSYTVIPQED
jgi:hypothetical protein